SGLVLAVLSSAVPPTLFPTRRSSDLYRSLAPVNGVNPPFLSLSGLNQIRAAYDLPPIVRYDVKVRVNGVATRVIPDDRFIYLPRSEEHTSELQSRENLVCRLLLEKNN